MSVNADKLVQIIPRIIDGGTPGLTFAGLFLTKSELPPSGRVLQFASAQAVGRYFGLESDEYKAAVQYFGSYVNTTSLPAKLFFATYREAAAAAWIRSAANIKTLAEIKQITNGSMSVTIDDTEVEISGVDLSAATSFSDAGEIIEAKLDAEMDGVTVSFSSLTQAWQITSATTGASSTVAYASGDLAEALGFTEQAGAVLSQGIDAQTLTECMANVLNYARDWVTFGTIWEPDHSHKIELAQWCSSYDARFAYVMWDTANNAQVPGTSSTGYVIDKTLELDGTVPVFNTLELAAWVMGVAASINFEETNGRLTFAFKQGEGLMVTCDNDEKYDALIDNAYNCYADFATAANQFKFFQNGSVTGKWDWLDTYINAIAIKDRLQLNLLDLFKGVKSIPYNEDGYAQIRTTCLDTIQLFVKFGAIRAGVQLSNTQKVQLTYEIGKDVSKTIESQGWYMLCKDPGAVVRGQRGTPETKFYYTDGGSIQKIVMPATAIQ